MNTQDDIIAWWDGKYHFNFWRPVTAIRISAVVFPITLSSSLSSTPFSAPVEFRHFDNTDDLIAEIIKARIYGACITGVR